KSPFTSHDPSGRKFGNHPIFLPESGEWDSEPTEPLVFGHLRNSLHDGREVVSTAVQPGALAENDASLHALDETTAELRHRVQDPANQEHHILGSVLDGLAHLVGRNCLHPVTDDTP